MLYPLISAIISGSLSYAYGIGALDQLFKKTKAKPQVVKQMKQVQYLAKDDAKIFATVTRVVTTSGKAPIVPNVYKITLNEFCYIIYSSLHKAPLAVHEYLSKDVITGDAVRDDKFFRDPAFGRDIPAYFGVNEDVYDTQNGISKNFQFHRGHMAAAANYHSSQRLIKSTNSLANIVPQNQNNNTGIWKRFENYARKLLLKDKCDTIEIVSGPIYYSDIPYTLNGKEYPQVFKNEQLVFTEGGLTAPPKLYKFIKCNTKQGSYASGFVVENKSYKDPTKDNKVKIPLASFEVEIQQIEKKTGLVFNCMKSPDSTSLPKLTDFDKVTLNKTKISLDVPNSNIMFKNQETIKEKNQFKLRESSDYGISIDLQVNFNKMKEIVRKELDLLKKPSDSACKQINQSLNYSKDLFQQNKKLYEYSKPQIEDLINAKLEHCLKKEDQDRIKGYISKKAFSQGSFKYPLQEKLREKFPSQAPKSTQ